ncbi:hypothetical protein [Lactiplantibacillus paraplantarum]|uniref:Uncharacterized protein n=1 Tax=Lactiplantibacillus paraplantarum TaxID=60520 RepID=A0A2I9DR33_9LACO|nr:hypothetical protein [Lactiplantibacillus paraplantarum]AVW11019.1 hypothetical protein DA077_10905 [Lactiplantibacillus paraplantarum]AYJ39427.1 hypothetical protein LP667_11725 [Lactiplantibacillus paraplantarum]ERL44901.1 hypothetical protein N644_0983 [Lactiplantibacillus paraplantarum]KRL47218.1 hypothetical protein FD48_GL002076 [Lactiplantibacillus paraplantarum DSM 10667]MCU4684483.1 hypothetical protein [Lactiplantibacillus paraplantarum]
MTKQPNEDSNRQQLYSDAYFDSGHWGLKIWQTIVGLVGWLAVIIPITVTILSIWSSYNHRIPRFWYYHEGIFEFKFIGILLVFCFALASLFAVTMTIIQNRKRERVVEQWPTFNPINQKKRQQLLAKFMDDRFGNAEFRENTRYYRVKPEQNLDTDQIQQLYQKNDLDDLND